MKTLVYYLSVSTLLTHELDAVKHAEWGLLYVLRDLSSVTAYTIFVLLHIPLIAAILWLSHHRNTRVQLSFRLAVAAFIIVHALIHYRLEGSVNYHFEGSLADGLIYCAAGLGLVYCVLEWIQRSRDNIT